MSTKSLKIIASFALGIFLLFSPFFVYAVSCKCTFVNLDKPSETKPFCFKDTSADKCNNANSSFFAAAQQYGYSNPTTTNCEAFSDANCTLSSGKGCCVGKSSAGASYACKTPQSGKCDQYNLSEGITYTLYTTSCSQTAECSSGNIAGPSKDSSTFTPVEPSLQVDIPTVQFSKITKEGAQLGIPYLAEYISGVYKYAVAIVGIIAIVLIMVGGLQWMMAGGNAGAITAAKNRITGAVIGLILMLGSYTLLYTVSPNLVALKSLDIASIQRQTVDLDQSEESYLTSSASSDGTAASSKSLANIKGDNMMSRVSGQATSDIVGVFQKAASSIAAQSCIIASASGARKNTDQLALTKKYCKWSDQYKTYINCKPAVGVWGSDQSTAKSTTCKYTDASTPLSPCKLDSYTHEKAIDAFAVESSTEKSTAGGLRCYGGKGCAKERCQLELIKAMNSNGACVLLGKNKDVSSAVFEPWHFEMATSKNSGYCFTNASSIIGSL